MNATGQISRRMTQSDKLTMEGGWADGSAGMGEKNVSSFGSKANETRNQVEGIQKPPGIRFLTKLECKSMRQ